MIVCMHVGFFVHMSAYLYFVASTQYVNIISCNIKLTETCGIAVLWKPDLFMFPKCIKTSRLITLNSELKVPELEM